MGFDRLMNIAHARITDPVTSHEAAARVKQDKLTQTQDIIVKLLEIALTDEELVEAFEAYCLLKGITHVSSPSGIRSRRNELYRAGKIEPIAYGKSRSGRRSIVWQTVANL